MIWASYVFWKANQLTKAEKRKYEEDRDKLRQDQNALETKNVVLQDQLEGLSKKRTELDTLLKRATVVSKMETSKLKFVTARVFDYQDMAFLEEMNKIFVSEELRFLIFALKEECMDQINVGTKDIATEWFNRLSGITDVFTALQKYSNKYIEEVEKEKNPQNEETAEENDVLL